MKTANKDSPYCKPDGDLSVVYKSIMTSNLQATLNRY